MERPEPEALLFDVGNVLINVDFERVFAEWAHQSGADIADLRERFVVSPAYEQHERGEIDASMFFASLRRSLDIDLSDDLFLDGWNAIFVGEVKNIRPLLERAGRKLPLYAFSNTSVVHQAVWPKYDGLFDNFSGVFTSCDIGLRKPEPEAFLDVAGRVGAAPDRILFFDDLQENVQAARQLGMPAVQVRSINDISRALAPIL